MVFPCLSFLQLGNGSATVLTWLINLVTAGGVINYIVMCITYVHPYDTIYTPERLFFGAPS